MEDLTIGYNQIECSILGSLTLATIFTGGGIGAAQIKEKLYLDTTYESGRK